jgi:hypothetical protein
MTALPLLYRRFAAIDDEIRVSPLIESESADPGFPALVEECAGEDWEAMLRRGRYGSSWARTRPLRFGTPRTN